MKDVVIIDAMRTPIGALGGILASVRPDNLAAFVIENIIERNKLDPTLVEEVYFGCANQAGEDNRNIARMAALLAGLPVEVAGVTVNRLGQEVDEIGLRLGLRDELEEPEGKLGARRPFRRIPVPEVVLGTVPHDLQRDKWAGQLYQGYHLSLSWTSRKRPDLQDAVLQVTFINPDGAACSAEKALELRE